MKALMPLAAALVCLDGVSTDYTLPRTLRLVAQTSIELETTVFTMERDGEPVEAGFSGGSATLEERTVEQSLRVLEHEAGAPTKVRRAFETVERKITSEIRGESSEHEEEGPLHGVTLELAQGDGEVEVEVVEGSAPRQESALKGHSLTLSLDPLLASGDPAGEDAFDLSSEAILCALGLDLEDALFPRSETPEDAEGRRGSGQRPSALRNLASAEWKGSATPRGEVEHEGVACLELDLALEAEGDLEPFSFGGGGRRGRLLEEAGARAAENTITAKLEGRLLFAKEGRCPLLFELEGSVSTVRNGEFERDDSTTRTHSEQEGTFTLRTRISVEDAEDEK